MYESTVFNMKICGVGGQGVLSASILIGKSANSSGFRAKVSPSYEMAQRYGSVISDIRISNHDILCPEIPSTDTVHAILGFEPYELLRQYKYLSRSTMILVNTRMIRFTGSGFRYPSLSKILDLLRRLSDEVVVIDVSRMARQETIPLRMNMIMLGCFFGKTDFLSLDVLMQTIKQSIYGTEDNLKAVRKGYEFILRNARSNNSTFSQRFRFQAHS